jgi:hypothetical protein
MSGALLRTVFTDRGTRSCEQVRETCRVCLHPTKGSNPPRHSHPLPASRRGGREEAILPKVDEWLAELFDDDHLDDTCRTLAEASEIDPDEAARREEMRDRIAKMDAEIDAYRTVLREQPITAPEIGKWMAETVQDKRRLENLLGVEPTTKLTVQDVKAMVAGLRDITRALAQANPAIKAAAYAELGITVTYHQEGRALLESRPQPSGVADARVGGGTRTLTPRSPATGEFFVNAS